MLRKLFISLLILSALTSDGIINFTEILCDPSILTKEIIDVVLGYEGELTAAQLGCLIENHELKVSSTLFSSIKFSNCSFDVFSARTNIKSWILSNKKMIEMVIFLPFLFLILFADLKILAKDILLYRSDISPPVCIN
ncbi:hypothetical protein [Acetivibrio cellulolyticus]|uniref:hypothetical protein n=1 Tax=Acetivibrio cellulolyticus TaxID=35830 RepID=UPI0001E30115|nr:hypothetical protein [Acetivibrio cellulolyticus]